MWSYSWATKPCDPAKPIGMGCLGLAIIATKDFPAVIYRTPELPTTHPFQS